MNFKMTIDHNKIAMISELESVVGLVQDKKIDVDTIFTAFTAKS